MQIFYCEMSSGMLCRTSAFISFMSSIRWNPLSTAGTGLLVMKNCKGGTRPPAVNTARADRTVHVAFSALIQGVDHDQAWQKSVVAHHDIQ